MPEGAVELGYDGPVIGPEQDFSSVSATLSDLVLERPTPRWWYVGAGISAAGLVLFVIACVWTFVGGVGVWGVNIPVAWGFALANYVWWIGIASGGTFISSLFYLIGSDWRNGVNRTAETMTLCAAAAAGMMPILHLGRQGLFYWLFPYSTVMGVWPQFLSPLLWDFFALLCYILNSIVFWYISLVPDCATLRDRATKRWQQIFYGILALGWRGSAKHWQRYETASLLLAGLATPLVLSMHTVVSFDFAVGVVPGWHATIFPPYFVAGAIYSGFAMVLTLAIPIRAYYGMEDFITMRHIQNCAKVMLCTGLIVLYGYSVEAFMGWFSGDPYEGFMIWNRMTGNYWYMYWFLIFCNGVMPQALWFKKVRTNIPLLFCIALVVNVGMWLERFVIVVTSLSRDFLPSAWGMYAGTMWDWMTYIGTLGLFTWLMFIFLRLLPMISMFEMRTIVPSAKIKSEGGH